MEYCMFLVLLLASSSALAFPWWTEQEDVKARPSFCHSYECPNYDVIVEGNDYELRRYEKTVWVTTDVGMEEEFWENRRNMSQSFMKLFRYITGANQEGQKMDMTVPVVMSHTRDKVEMSFLIPAQFADNPPVPTEDGVSIYHGSGGEFYVRSFGWFGYIFGYNRYKSQFEELKEDLMNDGISFNEDLFFTAGYDSPWKMFNRHNEVWLPKQ